MNHLVRKLALGFSRAFGALAHCFPQAAGAAVQVFDICPMGLAFAPMSPAHLWVVGMPAVVTHALAARLVPEGGVPAGTAVAMGLVPTQQCLALRSHRGQQEVRSFSEYFPEQIMQLT